MKVEKRREVRKERNGGMKEIEGKTNRGRERK